MTTPLSDYLALVTSWHRGKPRFTDTLTATLAPLSEAQTAIAAIPAAFDLDAAVGVQLDILGEWIGRTRFVPHPIPGLYFAFDDPARGFDVGLWRGRFDTNVGLYRLDDDAYRRLLRAKIAANRWSGLAQDAQDVLDTYFVSAATQVTVEDRSQAAQPPTLFAFDRPGRGFDEGIWEPHLFAFDDPHRGFDGARWALPFDDDDTREALDMEMSISVTGQIPGPIDLAILGRGLIPIKPQGVSLDVLVTSQDEAPLFGFDVDNALVGGFDRGAFGVSPDYLAARAL